MGVVCRGIHVGVEKPQRGSEMSEEPEGSNTQAKSESRKVNNK